ncbi:YVTN family beta-propeller protein [Mycolicibacterium sp. BK556]|uniref:YncE family protein n=1 Tax=unclassified Mycolicibacterium TaxID=2636767 RepID=UPI0016093A4C|nr:MULTISPECIES: beta-propeller fold lactonase family protein [unclassified Mycolicibacterium]MBB3603262.1 YVTN family beta-propeller protein [Mycolicibacterium sp. BK556]MBB3633457.1 YVTN family beta-propeller protein [Mycolicibacterium sp. BK607]
MKHGNRVWLGAGTLTLGIGAALASGAGVASADADTGTGTGQSDKSTSTTRQATKGSAGPARVAPKRPPHPTLTASRRAALKLPAAPVRAALLPDVLALAGRELHDALSGGVPAVATVGRVKPASAVASAGPRPAADVANPVVATIPIDGDPETAVATPDGKFIFVANYSSGTVSVIDTATNTIVGDPIATGVQAIFSVVTPDSQRVYVSGTTLDNAHMAVVAIDTATRTAGAPIITGTNTGRAPVIAMTPNGRYIYVTDEDANSISVIDTSANSVVGTPITVPDPIDLRVTPDGKTLYVTS